LINHPSVDELMHKIKNQNYNSNKSNNLKIGNSIPKNDFTDEYNCIIINSKPVYQNNLNQKFNIEVNKQLTKDN